MRKTQKTTFFTEKVGKMKSDKSFWVIEWIRHPTEAGYVSYGRIAFVGMEKKMPLQEHDEYMPVPLPYANFFKTKKEADSLANWYRSRGGFGDFKVREVVVK